jgi:hypothetical protein
MIIKPTFIDHWKTRSLVTKLNDPLAPIYLIRLWGYCEASGKGSLDVPPFAVAAICQYAGKPEDFLAALVECGFVDRDGEAYRVHEWEAYNAGLLTARANGAKGGRPTKTHGIPTGNPRVISNDAENPSVTHGLTHENPRDTDGLPTGNRPVNPSEPGGIPSANRLDRIGVDKIGEELEPPIAPQGGGLGNGILEQQAEDEAKAKAKAERAAEEERQRKVGVRLNALFGRRTKWTDREHKTFLRLWPITEEDLELIEAYYGTAITNGKDFRRRDLGTLLNNWPGEVDRARHIKGGRRDDSWSGPSDQYKGE